MKNWYVDFNQAIKSYQDIGLLIFRLGLGGMFMWHGFPKIFGGMEKWTALGETMGMFGIHFVPAFWGFMSGFAEFFGGLLIALGLFYRLACLLLVFNLSIAFASQMIGGKGLMKASQSLEDGFSFLAAFFVGPGKYSVDEYLQQNKAANKIMIAQTDG
ncbi:MAG TPA: DoxX family protein [Methylomusa anaerophila]|uniref:DoxX n=1 Tax=Methylomusa anaerophila TaxID=1930071 RepID=A0A348AFP8_9FIRM|nr:DoxX family protein [Methylomusa anaerophila]BBB89896.1 DoxX [Methylomusa anaerophila]HML90556.1 DoxX family protein [Methylomusa anaerophila]